MLRVEDYTIHVDASAVADLKARLKSTRWPSEPPEPGWKYGAQRSFIQDLAEYWEKTYDWEAAERRLNTEFRHFTLHGLQGVERLHFVHQKSPRPDARPLLLVHGWPGSFFEYSKVIPLLTDPAEGKPAFHVVVPSLPGFGFSSAPTVKGFGIKAMAASLNTLMVTLGYESYFAQGGDWGAYICKALGMSHSASCKALHLTSNFSMPTWYNPLHYLQLLNATKLQNLPLLLSKAQIARFQKVLEFLNTGNGYFVIQKQQPQTLSFAMNDSPAGLLAWIVEKFWNWSDHSGDLFEKAFTRDDVLTNAALYWFTGTAPSSFRIYYEATATGDFRTILSGYCSVPTAMSLFPVDINGLDSWAHSSFNLRSLRHFPHGGHFAALEEPRAVVEGIQRFFPTCKL